MARTKTDSEALDHGLRAMEDIGTFSFRRAKPMHAAMAPNPVARCQREHPDDDDMRRLTRRQGA